MGVSPIHPVIQPITIDTILNNNALNIGVNIGDGLNFGKCEQIFTQTQFNDKILGVVYGFSIFFSHELGALTILTY